MKPKKMATGEEKTTKMSAKASLRIRLQQSRTGLLYISSSRLALLILSEDESTRRDVSHGETRRETRRRFRPATQRFAVKTKTMSTGEEQTKKRVFKFYLRIKFQQARPGLLYISSSLLALFILSEDDEARRHFS